MPGANFDQAQVTNRDLRLGFFHRLRPRPTASERELGTRAALDGRSALLRFGQHVDYARVRLALVNAWNGVDAVIRSFIAGGIAACGAVTVTHSFETVKIRLQLQGELQAKQDAPKLYRGVLHGISVIYRNEGLRGLLRGLSCAYIYQMTLNGCRLGFYEPIRTSTNSPVSYTHLTLPTKRIV